MNQSLAESFAQRMRIAVENVIREELEMAVLRGFFESKIGNHLVFKGGTALKLAYGSPRFSDDLDFSIVSPVREADFQSVSGTAIKNLPEVDLIEALKKQFTLFTLYRCTIPYLRRPFSIKVEISTRRETLKRGQDYNLKLLTSEVTNISVLAQVATLERLWQDKQKALASRRQPRDLYDLWFISQKLGRKLTLKPAAFDPKILKRELHKYLPKSHWKVIDQWIA
jgi:predicted nucleotidyltransferase component of viral defense system